MNITSSQFLFLLLATKEKEIDERKRKNANKKSMPTALKIC